jgi:hypothetical protein
MIRELLKNSKPLFEDEIEDESPKCHCGSKN